MRHRDTECKILLVEDSPADVVLTKEALRRCEVPHTISVVGDGVEALEFLRNEGRFADAARPSLILLDLNLPRMNGRDVLAELAVDPVLSRIPVVVLSTSRSTEDVSLAYAEGANCYIAKPFDIDDYTDVIRAIERFWMEIVVLPDGPDTPIDTTND